MSIRTAQELRSSFLDFFGSRGHLIIPSSPLVPRDDPSILLINAGMTPLKKYFTGQATPPAPRLAGVQKCVRTLDIEQVGRTPRHCTFFEMLGNFSFGDYFKAEVIPWAWTFLTEVCAIDPAKLMVSVHENDPEAYDIWLRRVGLPAEKIVRLGDVDNFWFMAETGPCGPDSEIFYDLGPKFGSTNGEYDGPGSDYGRWIEIWNLVFTQFDRHADGTLHELPKKNVDTGSGLERMCTVLQGVETVFETDGFTPLLEDFRAKTRRTVEGAKVNPYYVLADHLRATSFLIADGVYPDRVGRGYVLRRIMRRALRWANRMGFAEGEWFGAFPLLQDLMGTQYHELMEKGLFIRERVATEEELFLKTLSRGESLLQKELGDLFDGGQLGGDKAFTLYDTYGFPLDLTKDIVEEAGLTVDEAGFNAALAEQRARSKADTLKKLGSRLGDGEGANPLVAFRALPATRFTGYSGSFRDETKLLAATAVGEEDLFVALAETPFYAESGGQIGDKGQIIAADGTFTLEVLDTQKTDNSVTVHRCRLADGALEALSPDTAVIAFIDTEFRIPTMRAHSCTHLMHSALRQILGTHVEQAGSLVEPDRLRFDFKHFEGLTPRQIHKVDRLVNRWILADLSVEKEELPIDLAKQKGAIAMFGEKYGDTVRVVSMGEASIEFCGGTHLDHTAEIGSFVLIREESIASGTRRVTALTGEKAVEYLLQQEATVQTLAGELKVKRDLDELLAGVQRLKEESKSLREEVATLKSELARGRIGSLMASAERVGDTLLLATEVPGASADELKAMAEGIRAAHASHALLLIGGVAGQYSTLAALSPDLIARGLKAGQLIAEVGKHLGAGGGGRPDMAQGGGKDPAGVAPSLAEFAAAVRG